MTLDEAIKYYLEEATLYAPIEEGVTVDSSCEVSKYVKDNYQLAGWLTELKRDRRLLASVYNKIGTAIRLEGDE